MAKVLKAQTAPDMEAFRLRSFIERLIGEDLAETHDAPIDLMDVAAVLKGNPKAVLFRNVGPEGAELVGGVNGSRARIAAAFDAPAEKVLQLMRERLARPQALVEIDNSAFRTSKCRSPRNVCGGRSKPRSAHWVAGSLPFDRKT